MPVAADFLNGFGFIVGRKFDGFELTQAVSTHESVKRYQEYRYAIELTFAVRGATAKHFDLLKALLPTIQEQHIIYGIRNPYRCVIDTPDVTAISDTHDEHIMIKLVGHSYRTN